MDRIFYSWQSDLTAACNRTFIQDALEKAAKAIRNDNTIEVEPVIDRDTMNEPGSPDIAHTIFRKIAEAMIFVCDVSFINSDTKRVIADSSLVPEPENDTEVRLSPNPNVLIELGYALHALGPERIIMVMNTAYGRPDQLPFDLRSKRVLTYNLPNKDVDRTQERSKLVSSLDYACREIFKHHTAQIVVGSQQSTLLDIAIEAIDNESPKQKKVVKDYTKWLIAQLDTINPFIIGTEQEQRMAQPDLLSSFCTAADQLTKISVGFNNVTSAIATMNSEVAANTIHGMFAEILNRYDPHPAFTGSYANWNFDFYRLAGYQLFILFVSNLLEEERWELLASLLNQGLYVENTRRGKPDNLLFGEIAKYPTLINNWNSYCQEKTGRGWLMPLNEFIKERFEKSEEANTIIFTEFAAADLLLFLKTSIKNNDIANFDGIWRPWCMLGNKSIPKFIVKAQSTSYASNLSKVLGVDSPDNLGEKLGSSFDQLYKLFGNVAFHQWPFEDFKRSQISIL